MPIFIYIYNQHLSKLQYKCVKITIISILKLQNKIISNILSLITYLNNMKDINIILLN
jgi:hypothetical protein